MSASVPATVTPTTELDAINLMLASIGAAPVAQISGVMNEDVIVAISILKAVVNEIQLEEHHFNTEDDYPFTPDKQGHITVPPTITRIFPSDRWFSLGHDITIRGSLLYDKTNHTHIFDEPFTAFVVLRLPFDQLPEEAKNYAAIRAARKFQAQSSGEETLYSWSALDESSALAAFIGADTRQAKLSLGARLKEDPIGIEDLR